MSKLRILDLLLSIAGTILILGAAYVIGPAVETRWHPVYSKFKIETIQPMPDGSSTVTFSYTKLRNCEPAGFRWFVGEPGAAFRQIDIFSNRPAGKPVSRPLGHHISVPYSVDVTPEALVSQGFASIYNNCHPFWVTRSVIYP